MSKTWNPNSELAKKAAIIAKQKHSEGYNKLQLVECSKEIYGGFGVAILRPGIQRVTSMEDVGNMRNAMANIDGRYPLGISDCEVVGINGDCGLDCPVFRAGNCKELGDLLESLEDDQEIDEDEKSEIRAMYIQDDDK